MSAIFLGFSIIGRTCSWSSRTLSSLAGYAHISSTTGLPDDVAMSNVKPASRKWSIGTNIYHRHGHAGVVADGLSEEDGDWTWDMRRSPPPGGCQC